MKLSSRRVVYWLFRPFLRLLLRIVPVEDHWERLDYRVPVTRYGMGSRHDFSWYFEGDSLAHVQSLDELQDWLLGCEYVHDADLFHEPDFWQHPCTFERLRRGDCEDHALWAWRHLLELGYEAQLVAGRCLPWNPIDPDDHRGHVWVVFKREGTTYLLEAVAKSRDRMIRPLSEAAGEYRPEFGVDHERQRFAFAGYLATLRDREFGVAETEPARRTA